MILTGALVNGIAIVAGGLAGTFGGKLMPERMKQTLLTAAALLAMGIGISGLSSSNNQLIPILSLILGTIVGELLNIEHAVERMGAWLQKKFSGIGRITEGFVTGTLVFAVGAMAVMGGLDSGLKNDHTILFAKSIIDCVSAVAFAGSMGIGVAFAGGSVLLVEGLVTILASLVAPLFTEAVLAELTFTGSLLLIGIGLNVMGLTKLRILNMMPAVLFPILLCQFM
ncbi:MAG: DUF554 domain-containing protein [Oscillospiraceae bacterium]|nr:DUF554 domain-containing protein [Oscillospiraceae bacterium]